MKVRRLVIGALVLGMAWATAGVAWAGDRLERRQDRQTERIYNGVRNGTISPREFKRLGAEQFRIAEAKRRALADGYLARPERRHLERMQDRAGKRIHQVKHNDRRDRGRPRYGSCEAGPQRARYGGPASGRIGRAQ